MILDVEFEKIMIGLVVQGSSCFFCSGPGQDMRAHRQALLNLQGLEGDIAITRVAMRYGRPSESKPQCRPFEGSSRPTMPPKGVDRR